MGYDKHRLVIDIRQNGTVITTSDPDAAGDNVQENTFPGADLKDKENVRLYFESNEDQPIDVDVMHTNTDDDDWSGEQSAYTASLAAGDSTTQVDTTTLTGPMGKVRLSIDPTGGAANATAGTLVIELLAS